METGQIIYSVLLVTLVASALIGRGLSWNQTLQMALIWLAIFAAIIGVATYWGDISNSRFAGNLVPGKVMVNDDGSMDFFRSADGHFYINANVNNHSVRFMLDTGATDIVLSAKDAKKVGINIEDLQYNKVYNTANGQTRGASVRLNMFEIGGYDFQSVPASVNEGQMVSSLLGMSFLNNMRSYSFEGNKLTIYP